MSVKPIPDGYTAVTPYLVVHDAASLVGFLQSAFGAEVVMRMPRPDGAIAHAELRIGGAALMLGEACERMGEMPASLYLYLPGVDAVHARALAAGAVTLGSLVTGTVLVRRIVLGNNHEPARILIQPVHNARARHSANA